MKNKYFKVVGTIFVAIFVWFCLFITSNAASFSASISNTTVNVGDTITVTVTADNAAGMYSVFASNSNVALSDGDESEFLEDDSTTVTYKATKAGTVTITAIASDMTDLDSDKTQVTGSKSFTVTIKEKETSSGGNSSGNNSSSGNGSSGNSSSGNNATPSMSFTTVNQTVYATSSVYIRESYTTNSDILGSLEVGQSITMTGVGDGWSRVVTKNGQTGYISSQYLDTENPLDTKDSEEEPEEEEENENEEEKSNVKTLRSLTVEQFTLEPEFDPDITEYSLTVGADVEKLDIGVIAEDPKSTVEIVGRVIAEDPKSTVEIVGNNELLIGENTVNVKVTAEDGTVRTYTINVTKLADVGVKLSELSVENYTLSPEFSSDVFEYTLNITDTNITNLAINAKSDEENVDIEIVGNNELKLGKNIITILVTSKDDNLTTTYQIVVNIEEPQPENNQIIAGIDNNDLFMYIGIGVVVLVILIIIIVVIVRKRRNAKETNDYDDEEDFAPLNTYSLENISNDEKSEKLENTDLNSNKDTTITDNAEQDNENKRKEKLEEFSSYASSSDSDTNTTSRKRGKHF